MSNMLNFKYEILLNEETGLPYVNIASDQVDLPEHKFMALEITRYLLIQLIMNNEESKEMDKLSDEDMIAIASATHTLEQISLQIALLLKEQNNALNDLGLDIKFE